MVTRFLVSGTDDTLTGFHLSVCMLLNAIERRGQTILYTCMGEDRDAALAEAKRTGVTMQESDGTQEQWTTIVQGEHPGWTPPAKKPKPPQSAQPAGGPTPRCSRQGAPSPARLGPPCSRRRKDPTGNTQHVR